VIQMIKSTKDLTLLDLERLLNGKKNELEQLLKKREQLERQLTEVVEKIRSIEGKKTNGELGGVGRRIAFRLQNDRTLKEVVTELLTENAKGLGLDELSKKVLFTIVTPSLPIDTAPPLPAESLEKVEPVTVRKMPGESIAPPLAAAEQLVK